MSTQNNSAFNDFRFAVGDIVRHRASYSSARSGATHLGGVVLQRLLIEGAAGIERGYSISTTEDVLPLILEIEIEAVLPQRKLE